VICRRRGIPCGFDSAAYRSECPSISAARQKSAFINTKRRPPHRSNSKTARSGATGVRSVSLSLDEPLEASTADPRCRGRNIGGSYPPRVPGQATKTTLSSTRAAPGGCVLSKRKALVPRMPDGPISSGTHICRAEATAAARAYTGIDRSTRSHHNVEQAMLSAVCAMLSQ